MRICNEHTVVALFGEKYANGLPPAGSGRLQAVRCRLGRGLKEYEEVGEPQPLGVAALHPLEGREWWCPVVFDGARWKVLPIPPPWLTKSEWDSYQESAMAKGLNQGEPYGKGFLRLMRDTAQGVGGDLSVSADDRRQVLDQLDTIFAKMEGCVDEEVWSVAAMAFAAGQHFSKLFSDEEGRQIALKGFKQVQQQGKGRPKGGENATSKRKASQQAKLAYQKRVSEIVTVWRKSGVRDPYEFMELLVAKGLAVEGELSERGKYQLAGKGKFQLPANAVRKIRDWEKKISGSQ